MFHFQAATRLVQDLQMTDKDIFVLRALLMADLQGDGTLGGDCMIQIFHARTPPEIWLHCMVCQLGCQQCWFTPGTCVLDAQSHQIVACYVKLYKGCLPSNDSVPVLTLYISNLESAAAKAYLSCISFVTRQSSTMACSVLEQYADAQAVYKAFCHGGHGHKLVRVAVH